MKIHIRFPVFVFLSVYRQIHYAFAAAARAVAYFLTYSSHSSWRWFLFFYSVVLSKKNMINDHKNCGKRKGRSSKMLSKWLTDVWDSLIVFSGRYTQLRTKPKNKLDIIKFFDNWLKILDTSQTSVGHWESILLLLPFRFPYFYDIMS